ncbi:MAG: site-specific integrase [Flavobacteriales bacterium]|nr:MAG: site-specific integrase [Flavobacteriales bacterium]
MKSIRTELAIINGVRFILVTPHNSNTDKYPLYCIEYFYNGKQFKVKERVKTIYNQYLEQVKDIKSVNKKLLVLRTLFESKINGLVKPVAANESSFSSSLTLQTKVIDGLNKFFQYHSKRHEIGEIKDIYNYTERDKKVTTFINKHFPNLLISDLSATVWIEYRSYLKKWGLGNSTINLQMVYVKGFYIWLSQIMELPITNHASKLKKLDITLQSPKYNEIKQSLFLEFFNVVNTARYLRLHLMARLVAENTLRPIQVLNIKVKHIELSDQSIMVFDAKGKKWRRIIISEVVKGLIQSVYDNTINAGRIIDREDYIIGFFNQTKQRKIFTQTMFRERILLPFKEDFPQFANILIYDFKHTSITKALKVNSVYEVQKRAGHSKVTTTQIYDRSDSVSKAITIEELSLIK